MLYILNFWTCFRIIKFARAFIFSLFALLLMHVSQAANAALSLTAPTTDEDGNFTLSWTGGGAYALVQEKINGIYTTFNGMSGASGSQTITGKAPGTYYYRIQSYCQTGPYAPTACDYRDATVVVTGFISPASPSTVKYTYDALGRLQVVEENNSTAESYQYDRAGNRCKVISGKSANNEYCPDSP